MRSGGYRLGSANAITLNVLSCAGKPRIPFKVLKPEAMKTFAIEVPRKQVQN